MRDIIKLAILALVLCIILPLMGKAAPVTLAWDAPVAADMLNVKYTVIYDALPSGTVEVARAICSGTPNVCPTTVSFTAPIGPHNWIARFFDGFQESGDSNTVATPTQNPKNLRKN
jgi:hypothetical protein